MNAYLFSLIYVTLRTFWLISYHNLLEYDLKALYTIRDSLSDGERFTKHFPIIPRQER